MRNHLSLIVVALGLALSIGTASADEYIKGLKLSAEQGFASAQFNLGLMYAKGEGV